MPLNIMDARMWMKGSTVSGATPTIPVSNDHTDGSWTVDDIYNREYYLNLPDKKLYMRMENTIRQIAVLPPGITTGDVLYINTLGTVSRLGIGTNGEVLTSDGTIPYWSLAGSVSGGTNINIFNTYTASTTQTINYLLSATANTVTYNVFLPYTGLTNDILLVLESVSGNTGTFVTYNVFQPFSGLTYDILNVLQSVSGNSNFVTYNVFNSYTGTTQSTLNLYQDIFNVLESASGNSSFVTYNVFQPYTGLTNDILHVLEGVSGATNGVSNPVFWTYTAQTATFLQQISGDTFASSVNFSGTTTYGQNAYLQLNNGSIILTDRITPFISGDTGTRSIKALGHGNTASGAYTFVVGQSNAGAIDNGAVIGGQNNSVSVGSQWSSILGGCQGSITQGSTYSTIIGGCVSTITLTSPFSAIIGGGNHQITQVQRGFIAGGCQNTLAQTTVGSIIGGGCNTIQTNSTYAAILGGNSNIILNALNGGIVGGTNAGICASNYAAIIAGTNNTITGGSTNSVIIGGSGMTIAGEVNKVLVQYLKVKELPLDNTLTRVLMADNVGNVLYRSVTTITGGTAVDTSNFVTNNTFQPYTGLTYDILHVLEGVSGNTGGLSPTVFYTYTGVTQTTLTNYQNILNVLESVSGACLCDLTGFTTNPVFWLYTANTATVINNLILSATTTVPAPPVNSIQYNNNGLFGGSTYHTHDPSTYNYLNSNLSVITGGALYGGILGGQSHTLSGVTGSVILGGSGHTLTQHNTVWVQKLQAQEGIQLNNSNAPLYMGDEFTDGSWRFVRNANNQIDFQVRMSGVWISKSLIRP